MSPIFFLRNYNYGYNEHYVYYGYFLYRVEILFSHSLFCFQHIFSTFAWDTVCSYVKLCAEASELFRQPVFQVVFVHKILYWERIQNNGNQRVLNLDCGEEGKQIEGAGFHR